MPNEQIGRLQIATFDTNVGVPANNATIRITPRYDRTNVLEEIITDASGRTPVINLPAPPLEYSLETNMPKPYSEYDIMITSEGYDPIIVEGVQILPDCTAHQDVRLIRSTNNQLQIDNILINDHTLWSMFPPKIYEEEVKQLPESLGYVVLPDPVIPEYVIVHDGVPNNRTAKNYWVSFKDYIKNVASCEIYSTWPRETIKANTLAIISFTLNRIYTEWYRGKGYNFTITSSTAYDHAFSYGRNIYDEISSVVDEIFTTFVTRPNIRQPLLTQYCDGKNVTCSNWMSQWGSKTLGDQGHNAISILRNFYGHDVYLMEATKVSGVPASYPGTHLQVGSSGNHVRTIQEQLNAISNNYPAINKLRVDGIFGEQTRLAVETFQGVFNLPANGIVDFPTWYKISDIYVAVTRMGELV